MKLIDLQSEFANYIYDKTKDRVLDEISDQGVSKVRRLKVYHNNVIGTFNDVLSEIYAITKKIVGDDYFETLCYKYHEKYRSKSGNLDDYGYYFPQLLNILKKEHKLLYLKDLAKLEWLYHRAYFVRDVKPINIKKLQSLSEEDYFKVRFKLHPSCCLMASKYPVYSIYKCDESKGNIKIKNNSGEFVLVERSVFDVNFHKISKLEYLFLQNVKNKNNIYQIYEILIEQYPNFDIGSIINKYISIGVLSNFTLK